MTISCLAGCVLGMALQIKDSLHSCERIALLQSAYLPKNERRVSPVPHPRESLMNAKNERSRFEPRKWRQQQTLSPKQCDSGNKWLTWNISLICMTALARSRHVFVGPATCLSSSDVTTQAVVSLWLESVPRTPYQPSTGNKRSRCIPSSDTPCNSA